MAMFALRDTILLWHSRTREQMNGILSSKKVTKLSWKALTTQIRLKYLHSSKKLNMNHNSEHLINQNGYAISCYMCLKKELHRSMYFMLHVLSD